MNAETTLAALLRLERLRQPVMDRAALEPLLAQMAEEVRALAGLAGVRIALRADAFVPPFALIVAAGEPIVAGAPFALQGSGAALADLAVEPAPPVEPYLALLLRVASESIAEVWASERQQSEQIAAERRTVALELHDAGKQVLPAIMLFAERAEHDLDRDLASAREMLHVIREIAQQGLDDMAFWLGELRGRTPQEDFGLAVHRLLAQIARAAPNLRIERQLSLPRLPWRVAACLLGMLRGALANVLLHSRARTVSVAVQSINGGVQATVCDDGVGIELQEALAAPGIGLESIFERAAGLGGRATLEEAPSGGVCLVIWLPLPAEEHTHG